MNAHIHPYTHTVICIQNNKKRNEIYGCTSIFMTGFNCLPCSLLFWIYSHICCKKNFQFTRSNVRVSMIFLLKISILFESVLIQLRSAQISICDGSIDLNIRYGSSSKINENNHHCCIFQPPYSQCRCIDK